MNIELNEIYWRRYKSDKSHGQTWLSLLIDYNPTKHWEDSFKKIIFNIWSFLDTIYNTHVAHLVKLPSMLDFVKKINIIMIVTRILLISLASSSYGVKTAPEMSTLFRLQWLYFLLLLAWSRLLNFCWTASVENCHVTFHMTGIQQGVVTLVWWKQSLLMSKRNCGTRNGTLFD